MESTLVQQDVGSWALQAAGRCQSPSLGVVGQGFCLWSTRQISTPALRPSSGLLTQKTKTRSQKEPANFVLPQKKAAKLHPFFQGLGISGNT